MINWFKQHFIPHSGNNHRPLFLQRRNARAIIGLVIALELIAFIVPKLAYFNPSNNPDLAAVLPGILASLTNEERKNSSLTELNVSPLLTHAAQRKADDMATKGYFAHTSPDGKSPWYWLDFVGYQYDYAGENLAVNFTDSKDVTDAWMKSPSHRANIVKGAYTQIGTAVAVGTYQGRKSTFVVQLYANPKQTALAANQPQVTAMRPAAPAVAVKPNVPNQEVLGSEIAQNTLPNPTMQTGKTEVNLMKNPTIIEKIVSSPRHSVNNALAVVMGIVIVAMLLMIFMRLNKFHPDLVTNGLFVVAVISAILLINGFLGSRDIVIAESVDYSYDQVHAESQ